MDLSQPLWLWLLLVLPLVWALFLLYDRGEQKLQQLERFIDSHLLPYLLLGGEQKKKRLWRSLLLWSFVWSCLVLALSGPRWNFREINTFTRDQSLVLLLDLSASMNAKDISPSRLGRAKQKIEDLLHLAKGVKIGLIAFAADPHMIVPLTEDKQTIRHLLPSLDTDLVYVQGSKLSPALEMAATLLANEPGNNKAIVVLSDGGFEDGSALQTAKRLTEKGIVLYTIGVGSLEGVPLKDRDGVIVKKNSAPIISKLEKEKFSELSKIGQGRYFDATHGEEVSLIFADLEKRSTLQQELHKTHRLWQEQFYLFLLPILPSFLWWYRRGYIFAPLLFMVIPTYAEAAVGRYFLNAEERAKDAYEKGDYTAAAHTFQDPYRKGVAHYRLGDYVSAEKLFRKSTRPEVAASAAYNLGNALVQQNKLQEAVAVYEDLLQKWPDHKDAQENLELVKKMLEQQEAEKQKEEPQPQKENQTCPDDAASDQPSQNREEEKESSPQEGEAETVPPPQESEKPPGRAQEDLDADLWLNQIKNDPKSFLKKKFYLESKKNGTTEEVNPW